MINKYLLFNIMKGIKAVELRKKTAEELSQELKKLREEL